MSTQDEQWVVFWCWLLGPILLEHVPVGKRRRFLKDLSQKGILLPNGQRKRISLSTLRRKVRRFREQKIAGLRRQPRRDRGCARKDRQVMMARAIQLKKDQPRRSDVEINQFLREEFHATIPKATLNRHLRLAGATRLTITSAPDQPQKLASKIRSVSAADKEQLQQWRDSIDRRLWERAVTILDCCDSTLEEICIKIERSPASVNRWIELYNKHGVEGLKRKSRNRSKSNEKRKVKTKRILEILHDRPKSYGINRSNWTHRSLAAAYEKRHGVEISKSTIGRLMNAAGYKMRKARRVLTSPDPHYREKVELLLRTLQSLKPTELLFFVDEMGPIRVKSYGGRCYTAKKKPPIYVDRQTSRGSVTLFGALSATTNQVTWFFGRSKDTQAMIYLAEILFNQHHDRTRLYITWDAASWHGSNALTSWLDAFNAQSRELDDGPIIEFVPLPSRSQFLDVIESVFTGMKRAVIHHSDYGSEGEMKSAISAHFVDRNEHFKHNPRRAGRKIWEIDFFNDYKNIVAGDYREW